MDSYTVTKVVGVFVHFSLLETVGFGMAMGYPILKTLLCSYSTI
jgi:hypothetical protein